MHAGGATALLKAVIGNEFALVQHRAMSRSGARRGRPLSLGAWFILLYALPRFAAGQDIIAKSSITACGARSPDNVLCNQKVLTTLNVRSTISGVAATSYQFQLRCVRGDDTGIPPNTRVNGCPCPCDKARDPSCKCVDLGSVLNITVTKSPVVAKYPIIYERSFNGKPYEEYLNTGGNSGRGACRDKVADGPTCGVVKDANGQILSGSQGVCCNCPSSAIFNEGFNIRNTPLTRAQRSCNPFKNGIFESIFRTPGAAICMRLSDTWWEGFRINVYTLDYTLTVTITKADGSSERLELKPTKTSAMNKDQTVRAVIAGDFVSVQQIPDLSDSMLFIPAKQQGAYNQMKAAFADRDPQTRQRWMIVPRSFVSLTGSEINKPGVDFNGWQTQRQICDGPTQFGLWNQLDDLLAWDLGNQSAAQWGKVQYVLSRFFQGQRSAVGADQMPGFIQNSLLDSGGNNNMFVNLPVPSAGGTMMTLEVAADDMRIVTNMGTGKLLSAMVCQGVNVNCGKSLEALRGPFYMYVNMTNTGSLEAGFTVRYNCTAGIFLENQEQQEVVPAKSDWQFTFEMYASTDEMSTQDCTVTLLSNDQLQDEQQVSVLLSATVYDSKELTVTGVEANKTGGLFGITLNLFGSCDDCGWNIFCIIIRGCIKQMIQRFMLYVFLLVVLTALLAVPCYIWQMKRRAQNAMKMVGLDAFPEELNKAKQEAAMQAAIQRRREALAAANDGEGGDDDSDDSNGGRR